MHLARGRPLAKRSILSFSLERWSGVWRSRHHIMSRLALENRVLFATSPFYVRKVFKGLGNDAYEKAGVLKVSDNLYSYIPPRWLPATYGYPAIERAIKEQRCRHIRRMMNRLGMDRPILYIWHPSFADMVGCFDEALLVYHVYDEYAAFDAGDHAKKLLAAQERALLERADIVFTSAEETFVKRQAFNSNMHVVRNAVDYDLFCSAQSAATTVPHDMRHIPKPVIGCVATQTAFMDLPLLTEILKQRPNWSFVFIGVERVPPDQADDTLRAFQGLPNVHFIGRRSLQLMPAYLKHCDVCVVPWLLHDVMLASSSPLKMYEYLAAGKPVVCTSTPPLRRHFDGLITFASDADEWIVGIEAALRQNGPDTVERLQAAARQHTWERRVSFIEAKIAEALPLRGA